jgi:hypothetical protein
MELKHNLLTNKYTRIFYEDKEVQKYGAPHHFVIRVVASQETPVQETPVLAKIDFQEGPIGEHGVNGMANEDALHMVLARLNAFQGTEFKCKENAMAITKIEEALLWLRARTMGREKRGIEGTHTV